MHKLFQIRFGPCEYCFLFFLNNGYKLTNPFKGIFFCSFSYSVCIFCVLLLCFCSSLYFPLETGNLSITKSDFVIHDLSIYISIHEFSSSYAFISPDMLPIGQWNNLKSVQENFHSVVQEVSGMVRTETIKQEVGSISKLEKKSIG